MSIACYSNQISFNIAVVKQMQLAILEKIFNSSKGTFLQKHKGFGLILNWPFSALFFYSIATFCVIHTCSGNRIYVFVFILSVVLVFT